MIENIKSALKESADVKLACTELADTIQKSIALIINVLQNGNKLLIMGNGGSAADAQHIAGELVGRFKKERKAIPAIALSTDTSILTAIGNDYGFDEIFSRQLEAIGCPGDAVLGISTSGNSKNIIKAFELAHNIGLKTVSLLGGSGGEINSISDISIIVPSHKIPHIQEAHIAIGHIMCDEIETNLISYFPIDR